MRVTVIIPYHSEPSREHGLSIVQDFYRDNFPEWECVTWYSNDDPYSKASSNNEMVEYLGYDETGILVFNDADSIVNPSHLRSAVDMAISQPGMVRAFSEYRRITRWYSEHLDSWKRIYSLPFDWSMAGSQSHGCFAIRESCYREAMGYDPRFIGWGYEDLAADILWSHFWTPRRTEGRLLHIWHESSEGREDQIPLTASNEQLYYHGYVKKQGDLAALIGLRKGAGDHASKLSHLLAR